MSKFFVLYSLRNMKKPHILKTLATVKKYQQQSQEFVYKEFLSQIDAQKFIFDKKIAYLQIKEQVQKAGLQMPQKQASFIKNKGVKQKSEKQDIKDDQNAKNDQKNEQKPKKRRKNKQTKVQQSNGQQSEQIILIPQAIDKEEQPQQIINKSVDKNEVMEQIMKMKLKNVYDDLLAVRGDKNQFVKSQSKIQIKSDVQYYGFFDGCSKGNPGLSGAGYFVINQQGKILFQGRVNLGRKTVNEAEYMAFLYLTLDCMQNKIERIKIFGDSQLVIRGVNGQYQIKAQNLKNMNILGRYLLKYFSSISLIHIERNKNQHADKLSNQAIKKKYLFQYKQQ